MPTEISNTEARVIIARLRHLLGEYFTQHGLKTAVFGKSEGLDSSVIAGLLAGVPGVQPIGVIMPIESQPMVREIAHEVLAHFRIPAVEIDLEPQYQAMRDAYEQTEGVEVQLQAILPTDLTVNKRRALGNIKARLRMITLYHIAQLTRGIVVSTDNYSEYWMGFWTLNGDVGDIAPIQQIFKGEELYAIARELGVPTSSLEAPPSDGLGLTPNSRDEEQLGVPYPILDQIVVRLLKADYQQLTSSDQVAVIGTIANALGLPLPRVQKIADQLCATTFKRQWPVIFTREQIGLPPL